MARGARAPGARVPLSSGALVRGRLEHDRGRDCVALRAQGPVLVISTLGRGAPYARLALSTDDPEAATAWLRQASKDARRT